MLKLLGALGGWQGYAAAAGLAALLSISATYYITSLGYRLTIAHMEAANANADRERANLALAQFSADADRIHESADAFSRVQVGMDLTFGKISHDFQTAIKAKPLPVDCVPDADRLRILQAAVAKANAAAGHNAVPAVPPAK